MKGRARHLVLGGVATLTLFLGVAHLSTSPRWRILPEDTALLRLSFTHTGDRSASCHMRTPTELANLPPNMRQRKVCDRRRPPVYVELDVDGATVFTANLPPTEIGGSGPSRVYKRFVLPVGVHDIAVRMRDRPSTRGFDYAAATRVTMAPAQSFVIDFRPEEGGFIFK